jgi:hypothetical protein
MNVLYIKFGPTLGAVPGDPEIFNSGKGLSVHLKGQVQRLLSQEMFVKH